MSNEPTGVFNKTLRGRNEAADIPCIEKTGTEINK